MSMREASVSYTSSPSKRAKEAHSEILAHADSIDKARRLPDVLANYLKGLGFFRLLVPRSLGGEELDWLAYLDVIRTIAHADGSVGWCVNQGAVFATHAGRAQRELAEAVWGDPSSVVGNGPPSHATYSTVEGGYQLTGKWNFSSGSRHANWLVAVAGGDRSGMPTLLHFVPSSDLEMIDSWQVHGLRGTGSFSFSASDHFVPENRAMRMDQANLEPGPLYVIPQSLLFACGFGCVALGVARSAVDCVIELAQEKKPQFARNTLAQDPVIQSKIGEAEGWWRGAKALLYESAREVWSNVCESGRITLDDRLKLRLAGTHAIRESAKVVDVVYNLSGSTAIFESSKIQRKFQDIHVITQQVQGREAHYQSVGSFLLGEEPRGMF